MSRLHSSDDVCFYCMQIKFPGYPSLWCCSVACFDCDRTCMCTCRTLLCLSLDWNMLVTLAKFYTRKAMEQCPFTPVTVSTIWSYCWMFIDSKSHGYKVGILNWSLCIWEVTFAQAYFSAMFHLVPWSKLLHSSFSTAPAFTQACTAVTSAITHYLYLHVL